MLLTIYAVTQEERVPYTCTLLYRIEEDTSWRQIVMNRKKYVGSLLDV